MSRAFRWVTSAVLLACSACAHSPQKANVDTLRPTVEAFHRLIRYKDFFGASELIVAERRFAFEQARRSLRDDRDLSITDFELEGARVLASGERAQVVSRMSWFRLPSVTENSATVTSEFVFQEGAWRLARQDAGPFEPELSAPYP